MYIVTLLQTKTIYEGEYIMLNTLMIQECVNNRFRLGQLLFISGVTFALFFGDGLRRILFLLALLLLLQSRELMIPNRAMSYWQRKIVILLMMFYLWIIFVPLLFGDEPLADRLEGVVRPIEFCIIMLEVVMFARDSWFIEKLKYFATVTCFIYSALAIFQRFLLGFNVDFGNWIITSSAWRVGTLLSGLVPWSIYMFLYAQSRRDIIFAFASIVMSYLTMFLTFYTTFWLVMLVQITLTFLWAFIYREKMMRICAMVVVSLGIVIVVVSTVACHYDAFRDGPAGLNTQLNQVLNVFDKFDASVFTNRRNVRWHKAVEMIKDKPVFGYGWADVKPYVDIRDFGHMHNSFLQAAWNVGIPGAIMYGALLVSLASATLTAILNGKKGHAVHIVIPFVVMLALSAYIVCGMLDDMFRSQRTIMTLYISTFMLMYTYPILCKAHEPFIRKPGEKSVH